jgi:hypothetical protein
MLEKLLAINFLGAVLSIAWSTVRSPRYDGWLETTAYNTAISMLASALLWTTGWAIWVLSN